MTVTRTILGAMRVTRVLAPLVVTVVALSVTAGANGASSASSFTGISAGGGHTCVVTGAGAVKCWGSNRFGELGNGIARNCNALGKCSQPFNGTPVDVVGTGGRIRAVSAGGSHTCALTSGGAVRCWGYNASGQLGNGKTTCHDSYLCARYASSSPVAVVGLTSGVRAVTAGDFHTCALTSRGGVVCWGSNKNGQLGNDSPDAFPDTSIPVPVEGLASGVTAVSAGVQSTCALASSGGVKCWGAIAANTPVDVPGLTSGATAVSAGKNRFASAEYSDAHACAVTTGGGAKCWGINLSGELGNGSKAVSSDAALDVVGLGGGIRAIAAGAAYTCALTAAGGARCWGYNRGGALGNGSTTDSRAPVDVAGLQSEVTAIAAGATHVCALMTGGGVKCWGSNMSGRLGNGTTAKVSSSAVDVLFSGKPPAKPAANPSPAAPATGASTFGFFKTPSGNILCDFVYGVSVARIRCVIKSGLEPLPPGRGPGCSPNSMVRLGATGGARTEGSVCPGEDAPETPIVGSGVATVMGYGKTWSGGGFRCTSAAAGLACRNRSGRGFFLSRATWRAL